MVRFIKALTFGFAVAGSVALLGAGPAAPLLPPQPATRPAGIPSDAMLVSPCVATMGEHWANLTNLPLGMMQTFLMLTLLPGLGGMIGAKLVTRGRR